MANWTRYPLRIALCTALVPVFTAAGGALAHADTGTPAHVPLNVCEIARSSDGLAGMACKGRIDGPDAIQVDLRPLLRSPRNAFGERRAYRADREWHEVVRTPLTGPVRGVQDTIMGLGAMLSDLGRQAGGSRSAQPVRPQAEQTGGPVRPEDARPGTGYAGGSEKGRPGKSRPGGGEARPGAGYSGLLPGGSPIGGGLSLLG